MSYIYLASPYTDKSDLVMHQRYLQALEVASHITRAGITVYSPIVHYHDMAKRYKMPRHSEFWEKHNKNMMKGATGVFILQIAGWMDSAGIGKEFHMANEHNIAIRYLPYPLEEIPKL